MEREDKPMIEDNSLYPYFSGQEWNALFPQEAEQDLADIRQTTGNNDAHLVRGRSDEVYTYYTILVTKKGAGRLVPYHEKLADRIYSSGQPHWKKGWRRHCDLAEGLRKWATSPA